MIKLFINGQRLVAEYPLIVSDTIDYIEVNAVFRTQDWDGATKWLHLSNGIDEFNVLFNNDTITKDGHFNLTDGTWKAFVHGTVNNTRITTNEIEIKVAKTGIIDGEPLPDIPPSAGEQILQIAQDAVTIAESVREDADNGLFNGEKGEKGDTGDKGDIGEKGDQGVPGFSPIATVAETDTGVSFSVTDQNGTTTVNMDRPADEWITIADITTTEEVCYVYFDLPCECKEVVAKVISPSTLTGGFWTSTTEALWSGTASGVNVVSWQDTKEITTIYKVNKGNYTEIEYIQNAGINNGEQYFATEMDYRNLLYTQEKYRENIKGFRVGTTFDDVSTSVFPVGIHIKIWGLKA